MTFSMAFDRKWVSDSSLDKLWNDTIEKKVANKQRRSPDFCKEAILSATLQRISSEMLTRRLSSPMVNDLGSDDEEEQLTFLPNVSSNMDCEERLQVLSDCSSGFAEDEKVSLSSLTLKSKCSNLIDVEDATSNDASDLVEMSEVEMVGRSPKRRWSETDENNLSDTLNSQNSNSCCSPAKRPRAKMKVYNKTSKNSSSCGKSKQSQSPTFDSNKNESVSKVQKRPFALPKVKIIPAEEDTNLLQKVELNSSLLSPVRSMVSSISELSIEVNDALPPREDDFWCLKTPQKIHDDPLDLDDFFNNLKKVTS